ncbi:MAG: hypothetical protein IPP46_18870 [Bacteroidetes bacterium]|nr:hypothetical protein [Bacteroidota bacterium]
MIIKIRILMVIVMEQTYSDIVIFLAASYRLPAPVGRCHSHRERNLWKEMEPRDCLLLATCL